MNDKKIIIDWRATVSAVFVAVALLVFPFVNPCETQDSFACTWNAENSLSSTNFYGITVYHP